MLATKNTKVTNEGESMKRYIFFLAAGLFLISSNVYAEDGKATFDAMRCGVCHKPDTGKSMPSLKIIAAAYKEKKEQLMDYFNGNAEPLVNPEKKGIMKMYIEKTKKLEDDQQAALADFIMSH